MINKNFFLAVNEMVSRAAGLPDAGIVDESSFIDFGKKLSSMNADDFKNAFANEIANKVRLSLDIVRNYDAKLRYLIKGQMPAGGILEIIQHYFMETRAAEFTELVNGTSPDMYKINKAAQTADYFIMESAFSLVVTMSDTELEGAFRSAQDMESFLNGKVTYLLNSYALGREQGRRSLLNSVIVDLASKDAAATNESSAQRYKLVTLFNTTYGLTGSDALSADDALYNAEFVKFAVMMINKVYKKLSTPSYKFNDGSIKTFTPDRFKRLVTIDALDDSIVAFKNTFSPDATSIPDHESVEFWQKQDAPLIVSVGDVTLVPTDADRGTETGVYYQVIATGKTYQYVDAAYVEIEDFSSPVQTNTPPTIAVLHDDLRIGEYLTYERTIATPINASAMYYNLWQHYQGKLVHLKSANAVIFTLE